MFKMGFLAIINVFLQRLLSTTCMCFFYSKCIRTRCNGVGLSRVKHTDGKQERLSESHTEAAAVQKAVKTICLRSLQLHVPMSALESGLAAVGVIP